MSSLNRLVGAATALVVCAGLAGCTSTADPPSASPSVPLESSSTPAAPVTLRFSVYGDEATVASYEQLAAAYTSDHPNVTIDVEHTVNAEMANAKIDKEFEQGNPPDVFLMDHDALPEFVADGEVQSVDELLEERHIDFGDDYQRLGLEAFSADSSLQCMPNNVSPLVVFYNRDLLRLRKLAPEGETPPTAETGWTWEEFSEAARLMTSRDVKGVYIKPSLTSLIPLVRSAGADVVDDDQIPTTLTMSDSATRSALEEVLTLVRNPDVTPTRGQLFRVDAVTRFELGKIGMMFGTRALVPRLRAARHLRFDVFPLPSLGKFRTISEVSGLCIAHDSQNVPAAADFLAFAVGDEGAAISSHSGGIVPANLPALHSLAFTQPGRQPTHVRVFSDGVRRSDLPPFVAAWPDVVSQSEPLFQRLFYAPVVNLDRLLPRIDLESQPILAPPSESPSP